MKFLDLAGVSTIVGWAKQTFGSEIVVAGTNKQLILKSKSGDSLSTLTFTGGASKFSISDGSNSFDVPITISISNNVTGSGTSGQMAVWTGTNTIGSQAIPTVNDAKFSVIAETTEVASTTANASTASSVTFAAGSNVTITPDATNKKITISSAGNVTGSSLTANQIILGNGSSTIKASGKTIVTDLTDATDNEVPTAKTVADAISALPTAMQFKGTLGTDGTATSLPTAAAANEGFAYKVITAGTYQSVAAKVGDMLISNGSSWVLIPSGDEPSGTVTNVATGSGLTGGPITSSGTISHADTSSQESIVSSARTYISGVTLDDFGHVTGLATGTETVTNTDRYVNTAAFASQGTNGANGTQMTLTRAGSDTQTVTATIPVATTTAAGVMSGAMVTKLNDIATGATAVTESTVSGWGFTKNTGTVTSVTPGVGLVNGSGTKTAITSTGTVKAALVSETALTSAAVTTVTDTSSVHAVMLDSNGKLAVKMDEAISDEELNAILNPTS